MSFLSKILSHEQVDLWISAQREAGRRIGFTCGSFDLLHAGHVEYLAKARAECDRLLVAVNTDASVQRYKSPLRPINPERERMTVIAALEAVDAVTVLEEERPLSLLLRWKPDLYIKGGDYRTSSLRSAPAVEAYGGRVVTIPSDFATSTTAMMERIGLLLAHQAPDRSLKKASRGLVLVDRDGTLVRDVPFLHDPANVELMPGAGDALAELQKAGYALAIVTNQQGIGLGYYTTQQMIAVHREIFRLLGPYGIRISRIYYCPHSAADECECRKPLPGMVRRAIREMGATPEATFLIGDTAADADAGRAAGCRTVLIGPAEAKPDYRAADLPDAARWVAAQSVE